MIAFPQANRGYRRRGLHRCYTGGASRICHLPAPPTRAASGNAALVLTHRVPAAPPCSKRGGQVSLHQPLYRTVAMQGLHRFAQTAHHLR